MNHHVLCSHVIVLDPSETFDVFLGIFVISPHCAIQNGVPVKAVCKEKVKEGIEIPRHLERVKDPESNQLIHQ